MTKQQEGAVQDRNNHHLPFPVRDNFTIYFHPIFQDLLDELSVAVLKTFGSKTTALQLKLF